MRRSDVLKLREKRSVPVTGVDGLEVTVVPSAGTTLAGMTRDLLTDEQKAWLCRSVFVDFKGYTEDDGKAIPNTMKARLELIDCAAVFYTVQAEAIKAQAELVQGEADAASD